jgi:hypothetical protein
MLDHLRAGDLRGHSAVETVDADRGSMEMGIKGGVTNGDMAVPIASHDSQEAPITLACLCWWTYISYACVTPGYISSGYVMI